MCVDLVACIEIKKVLYKCNSGRVIVFIVSAIRIFSYYVLYHFRLAQVRVRVHVYVLVSCYTQ